MGYGPEGTYNGFDFSQLAGPRIGYNFRKNLYPLRYRHVDDRRPENLSSSGHLTVQAVYGMD